MASYGIERLYLTARSGLSTAPIADDSVEPLDD